MKSKKLRQTYKNFSDDINKVKTTRSVRDSKEEPEKKTPDEEFDWADDQI